MATKFLTRISIADTVRAMQVGDSLDVCSKQAKCATIRAHISKLHKRGHERWTITDKGMIDRCIVKRIR